MKFVLSKAAQEYLTEIVNKRKYDGKQDDTIILQITSFGKYENTISQSGPTFVGDKVVNSEISVTGHFNFIFNTMQTEKEEL